MIDAQRPVGFLLADCAYAALALKHKIVVRQGNPIDGREYLLAPRSASTGELFFSKFGIRFHSEAPAFRDLLFISFAINSRRGTLPFPAFFILFFQIL